MRVAVERHIGFVSRVASVQRGNHDVLGIQPDRQRAQIPRRAGGLQLTASSTKRHAVDDERCRFRIPVLAADPIGCRISANPARTPDRVGVEVPDVGEVVEGEHPWTLGPFRLLALVPDGHAARLDRFQRAQRGLTAQRVGCPMEQCLRLDPVTLVVEGRAQTSRLARHELKGRDTSLNPPSSRFLTEFVPPADDQQTRWPSAPSNSLDQLSVRVVIRA